MPEKELPVGSETQGVQTTPAGNGQPAEKAPSSEPTPETVEQEIDGVIGTHGDETDDTYKPDSETDDGKVVLSKEKYDKLTTTRKSFLTGLKAAKGKIKGLKKPAIPATAGGTNQDTSAQPLTRAALNERDAIKQACEENADLDTNWNEVMKHFTPKRGKASVEAVLEDIKDAFTLWQARKPAGAGGNPGNAAADGGRPGGSGAPAGGRPEGKGKGGVLSKPTPASEWFPKPEKK